LLVTKTMRESPLLKAVQALDEELERFEQLALSAERVPLTSERNIEKAAKSINDAADSQKRVGAHIAALIDAITTARQLHDATAEKVIARRDELEKRADLYNTQLARFAKLGKEATEISTFVRQLGEMKDKPPTAETVKNLDDVVARMEQVVAGATELAKEAQAQDMEELERQCDSLRQQVQSALNKVSLLRGKIAASLG
jgi:uncharacterized protein YeeX (DUF496 family)